MVADDIHEDREALHRDAVPSAQFCKEGIPQCRGPERLLDDVRLRAVQSLLDDARHRETVREHAQVCCQLRLDPIPDPQVRAISAVYRHTRPPDANQLEVRAVQPQQRRRHRPLVHEHSGNVWV